MWFQLYGFVNLERYIIHEFILDVFEDYRTEYSTRTKANIFLLSGFLFLFMVFFSLSMTVILRFIIKGRSSIQQL